MVAEVSKPGDTLGEWRNGPVPRLGGLSCKAGPHNDLPSLHESFGPGAFLGEHTSAGNYISFVTLIATTLAK